MSGSATGRHNRAGLAIACIVTGMSCISVQDMLIKQLSGDYPLHEIVFARSALAIAVSMVLVRLEGGLAILRTGQPWLHTLRAALVVLANMLFFAGLAALPMAEATALFFVAPLFITLLSMPLLGERVGPRRIGAAAAGLAGVVIIMRPGGGDPGRAWDATVLLPVGAALAYALMQILTRRLGLRAKASAMAVYIQSAMIVASLGFLAVAGDGRFAEGADDPSTLFLLRAWRWPDGADVHIFVGIGLLSSVIAYMLAQAYRMADAATVSPFEYLTLPLAVMWGWVIWDQLPDAWAAAGIVIIIGAGLYVFVRERLRGPRITARRPLRRW